MKKILLIIPIFTFGISSLTSQTADEVIALYYDAIGGKEKFESVTSWHLIGGSKLTNNKPGEFQFIYVKPNKLKVKTVIDSVKIIQSTIGKKGWNVVPPMGINTPTPIDERSAEQLLGQNALVLGPFYNYKEKGVNVNYEGLKKIDSTEYKMIKVWKTEAGPKSYVYLDKKTDLIMVIETETTAQGKRVTYRNYISSYKEVDGLMMPFSFATYFNGNEVTRLELDEIILNRKYSDDVFELPESTENNKQ
jgi:outer membrane lipoprotein-sorting protein